MRHARLSVWAAMVRLGVAAAGALLAAPGFAQVLELPLAETVAANALAPSRADASVLPFTTTQRGFPFGDAMALVGDELFVTGNPFSLSFFQIVTPTVALWRAPRADDPPGAPGWRKVQDLGPISPPPGFGAQVGYGRTLATDGTWLFVGAPLTPVDGIAQVGAVHVYRRDPGGPFVPVTVLADPFRHPEAQFGHALAFDGTTLLVGVPKRRDPSGLPVGGADRFVVDGDGIGPPLSVVSPLQASGGSAFGAAVAVDGDTFALSSPAVTLPGVPGAGAVVLFHVDDPIAPRVSIEAVLTAPTGLTGTSFGADLAMDLAGDPPLLAVSAPGEGIAGAPSAGVARIYERREGAWVETVHVAGDAANDQLRFVELSRFDGRMYLSVCAVAPGIDTYVGRHASLYEFVGGRGVSSLTLLARAPSDALHSGVGRRAALGGGRWAIAGTDTSAWPLDEYDVRLVPLAAAQTDCDGDGASDLDEVLHGAGDCDGDGVPDSCASIADCNADGIPDACNVEWSPALPPPTAASLYYFLTGGGPKDPESLAALWVSPRAVPPGSDGVLRGVVTDWTSTDYANHTIQPSLVAVYDDPNQDGLPDDAVLRGAYLASPLVSGGDDRFVIDPIRLGPPGTSYFLGIGTIRLPQSSTSMLLRVAPASPDRPPTTWIAADESYLLSGLDLETLTANDRFELVETFATVVCEGLFRSGFDANGDGVVDECACNADLTGDGAVGPEDLAALLGAWGGAGPADLDGDGLVGAADLGVLLGAWGPCP
jgi:hypothetical protein